MSKARAATLGPSSSANQRRFPRTKLLQQLKEGTAAGPRSASKRRDARPLVAELQHARLTGVRSKVHAETMSAKLTDPMGVAVERGRIEVRFDVAKDAVERLYAMAHALVNNYERFERLVDGGERATSGERW